MATCPAPGSHVLLVPRGSECGRYKASLGQLATQLAEQLCLARPVDCLRARLLACRPQDADEGDARSELRPRPDRRTNGISAASDL